LHAEDRQLARDVRAVAAGTRDTARRARQVLLEVLAAATAAVFVDGHRLLAAPLDVALDELLGVLLEDVVNLVEQLVDVFLDLLALLGDLGVGVRAVAALCGLARPGLFSFLLCHLALHRAYSVTGTRVPLP